MILDCFCGKTLKQVEKKISDELHVLYLKSTTKEEERLLTEIDSISRSQSPRAGAIVAATALFLDKAGYSKAIWDGIALWRTAVVGVSDDKKDFAKTVLYSAWNIECIHSYGHLSGIKASKISNHELHDEFWKVKLDGLSRDEMFSAGTILMVLALKSLGDDAVNTDVLSATSVMNNIDHVYGRVKKKESKIGKPHENRSLLRK
jgi:hypothetical protein